MSETASLIASTISDCTFRDMPRVAAMKCGSDLPGAHVVLGDALKPDIRNKIEGIAATVPLAYPVRTSS